MENKIADSVSQHRALIISKKGHEEIVLYIENKDALFVDRLYESVKNRCEGYKNIHYVWHPQFPKDLLTLEQKHPQLRTAMKIGIICCKKGQVVPQDMFQNGVNGDTCGNKYWNFVRLLGDAIDLQTWQGYRGDMGRDQEKKNLLSTLEGY